MNELRKTRPAHVTLRSYIACYPNYLKVAARQDAHAACLIVGFFIAGMAFCEAAIIASDTHYGVAWLVGYLVLALGTFLFLFPMGSPLHAGPDDQRAPLWTLAVMMIPAFVALAFLLLHAGADSAESFLQDCYHAARFTPEQCQFMLKHR